MPLQNDDVSCAVITRQDRHAKWEFISYTLKKSVAFRAAFFYSEEEPLIDPKSKAQFAVVLREDWDQHKPIVPLRPPAGFEEDLIEESKAAAIRHRANMDQAARDRVSEIVPNTVVVPLLARVRRQKEPELAQVGEEIKPADPVDRAKAGSKNLIYTELEL